MEDLGFSCCLVPDYTSSLFPLPIPFSLSFPPSSSSSFRALSLSYYLIYHFPSLPSERSSLFLFVLVSSRAMSLFLSSSPFHFFFFFLFAFLLAFYLYYVSLLFFLLLPRPLAVPGLHQCYILPFLGRIREHIDIEHGRTAVSCELM